MKIIQGETKSEARMVQAIQRAAGALPDGKLGPATMVSIAGQLGADCWPLTLRLYGAPCIVGRDIRALAPKAGCGKYPGSLSGTFSWQKQPCSIQVDEGRVLSGTSCHAHIGKPETVLFRLRDGSVGAKRCMDASELPAGVQWAVGGLGCLGMWDPGAEGFSGRYADVLRRTDHTALGYKDSLFYGVYLRSMSGAQCNAFLRDKLCLQYAVLLDGGHVAAINGEEGFAQINRGQIQYSLIQFK